MGSHVAWRSAGAGHAMRLFAGLLALSLGGIAAAQVTYTYENTSSVAIGDNNCSGGGGITRSFNVSETFTVGASGTISLGIDIEHATRDQVRVYLTPPGVRDHRV